MYKALFLLLFTILFSCNPGSDFNADQYFSLVNKAELSICEEKYSQALDLYKQAFTYTLKPYGKDAFNAALVSSLIGNNESLEEYVQLLINNSEDSDYIQSKLVGPYISETDWSKIMSNKVAAYDKNLRNEMWEINERDQLFRPMYETHDDTINRNRIINLNRILDITDESGYPSHLELGYSSNLRTHKHDIVLHHTSQRRSKDKSVTDLEPLMKAAVEQGRFDPEIAIQYVYFQNDIEKGKYEPFPINQYRHHLLPDSLNENIWMLNLSETQLEEINRVRHEWHANTTDDILIKAAFKLKTEHPFIFSSVKKNSYLRLTGIYLLRRLCNNIMLLLPS